MHVICFAGCFIERCQVHGHGSEYEVSIRTQKVGNINFKGKDNEKSNCYV